MTTFIKSTEFLTANKWADANEVTQFNDAEWDAVVKAHEIAEFGLFENSITKTHETIEDFKNSRAQYWTEKGSIEEIENGVIFQNFQMMKGKPRIRYMIVYNLGNARLVLK